MSVALANDPSGATLGGTLTATASNGVATFSDLSLITAAPGYTLDVSASGLGENVTSAITVTPAAAAQVAITTEPPASVTAGSSFGLQATIEDQYGNVETGDSATLTVALASNPGGATLGGTTSVAASQGVASFSGLSLTIAATGYTLQAASTGLTPSTTGAITVSAAAAAQVVITQQPPSTVGAKAGFGLQAAIEDAYGNVITSYSKAVKVAFANNPTGATLGGTKSVTPSEGIAAFTGLTISEAGSGYTLALTSGSLTSATTSAITVTSASNVVPAAAGPPRGYLAPLVLDSPDFFDTVEIKKHARWA